MSRKLADFEGKTSSTTLLQNSKVVKVVSKGDSFLCISSQNAKDVVNVAFEIK